MSDQTENLKAEEISNGDRPLSIPSELPILPLRDTVLFPNSFMPLAVARESSVRLIDDAIANGKLIAVFTQRDAAIEEPTQEDLFSVGTATHIHKMFKLPDGSLRLIVQGLARLRLETIVATQPYLRAQVSVAVDDQHADQAGSAGDARHPRTPRQPESHPDQGARGARARVEDPVAGAVGGRQEPARVLPARADEGDPEGAGRGRRSDQGSRGAGGKD